MRRSTDIGQANCVRNDDDDGDDDDDGEDSGDDGDDDADGLGMREGFDFSDAFIAVVAASASDDACYRGHS